MPVMVMDGKSPFGIIIGVGIVAILLGIGIGLLVAPDNDDGGTKTTEQNTIILKNDAITSPQTTWDSENHDLIDLNARISGRIRMIEAAIEGEEDQYHFLLMPDLEFKSLANAENTKVYNGAIMIEIMKSDMFVLPRLYIGQHLEIQGPLVTDIRTGHGWNEIDPALMITDISAI
jgi:hypothetical protein